MPLNLTVKVWLGNMGRELAKVLTPEANDAQVTESVSVKATQEHLDEEQAAFLLERVKDWMKNALLYDESFVPGEGFF